MTIYALVDEFGTPRYVGQTIKDLATRLSQHRSAAQSGSRALDRWIRSCPAITIIPLKAHSEDPDSDERRWIRLMREGGVPLLNLYDGGRRGRTGQVHTEETRARLSQARKGKPLSAEHRAKLSAAHTGVPLSAEHREAIGRGGRGLVRSAETRARMSAARKGKPRSRADREAKGGDAL